MIEVKQKYRAAALIAAGLVAGGVLAGGLSAHAADDTSADTASSTASTAPAGPGDAPTNPNPGDTSKPQRADETLLTGDAAQSVKDAVLAKYPGATFVRVETDSDGVYEAHITKADGTATTVELDKDFAITGEEAGGPGGGGPGGMRGAPGGMRGGPAGGMNGAPGGMNGAPGQAPSAAAGATAAG